MRNRIAAALLVLLVCIPPVLLFLLLNKQIMEGVTTGAVKG